jgi:hypothetical protein
MARGCFVCEGQPGLRGQLLPLEWITGWRRQPGEMGIYFCSQCYELVAAEFQGMGFPSGIALMAPPLPDRITLSDRDQLELRALGLELPAD